MIAGQAGTSEQALTDTIALVMREHADRFPAVAATVADAAREGARDQAFAFGVERILDGIEALIRRR